MFVANPLSQALVRTFYEVESFSRSTNVAGALHTLADIAHLQRKVDSFVATDKVSIAQWAWRGALRFRKWYRLPEILGDSLMGTGQTHCAPGERPKPAAGTSVLAHELAIYKSDFQDLVLRRRGYDARLEWLTNRVAQTFHHPSDTGLAGICVGAMVVPMLFASSALSAAVGSLIGCVVYAAQKSLGAKNLDFSETCDNISGWFSLVSPALVHSFWPTVSLTIKVSTGIGLLAFDVLDFLPLYLGLQAGRLGTGLAKLAIAGLGAAAYALVGATILSAQSLATYLQASSKTLSSAPPLPSEPCCPCGRLLPAT